MANIIHKYKNLFKHTGFTLIELMIVITAIGIMTALFLPDFKKIIGGYQLDCAAKEMAAHIRNMQEKAMRYESADYRMFFNTAEHSYNFREDHRSDKYVFIKMPPGIDLYEHNFNRRDSTGLNIAANGNPINRFGGTITLKCRATGKSRYVIIDSIGRVRIDDKPPPHWAAAPGSERAETFINNNGTARIQFDRGVGCLYYSCNCTGTFVA